MILLNCNVANSIPLPDESVQCVVTSPPYWGLRDYGTAKWEGGEEGCDHKFDRSLGGRSSTLGGGKDTQVSGSVYRECPKCGARRIDSQLGLEPTPDEYISKMVAVFREVKRVLRKDGVCWVNIGDSYSGYHGNSKVPDDKAPSNKPGYVENMRSTTVGVCGLKPKDLVGIPWLLAFALRADGWWLRQDIIWAKPNPMPESVTDRCTKSHEYVFLLTKSERYYYDAEAIREASTYPDDDRKSRSDVGDKRMPSAKKAGMRPGSAIYPFRNKRSVWTIATQPFPGAHFATYPEKLVEPCILAGSKVGDTVLDPFCGSGTTGVVALRHGREFIGCDLNEKYLEMARRRIGVIQEAIAIKNLQGGMF